MAKNLKTTRKKKTGKAHGKRGNPNPVKQFGIGNTASKGYGRPKMTAEQKAMALTTRTQLKNVMIQYAAMPLKEIKKLLKKAELPAMDMALLKNIEIALESGTSERIDWINNHTMGKPKEVSHINLKSDSTTTHDLKNISKEEIKSYERFIKI